MSVSRLGMTKALAGILTAFTALFAMAQNDSSRIGLSVSVPNGYPVISVDDMQLASTAGPVRWSRTWDGKEWKFNPHWESLSQSWTNMTGSSTGSTSGVASDAPATVDSSAGCWVMVDEDWQPSKGTVLIDNRPPFPPMLSERTTPFNKLMGEAEDDYPPPRIVNVDYANLCKGLQPLNSPVRDLEAVRIKNELYLGENGRYAYSNRSVLEKRAVRGLAAVAASSVDALLAGGSIALNPVAVAKGFRWMDRAGEWIDFNTQGQVIAYGDKNDNVVWFVRDSAGTLRGVVDANGRVLFSLHYTGKLITEVRDYPIAGMPLDLPARSVKYKYDIGNRLMAVTDVLGNVTYYDYDSHNHVISITDQESRVSKLAYAGSSVKQKIAPDGGVTDYVFDYDDVNKQFTSRVTGPQTAAGRRIENFTHNRSGNLTQRMVNGRVEEEIKYDTGARAQTRTNARGFSSGISFNEFDQIVEQRREDGAVTKSVYSAVNLALTETVNAAGTKTTLAHDAKGNVVRMVLAAGSAEARMTVYEVDSQGRTTKVTAKGRIEANGSITPDALTQLEYDAQGNIQKIIDPELGVQRRSYNRLGIVVSKTDARNNMTVLEVDAAGRTVRVTSPLSHVWSFAYDKVGNRIASIDANARATRWTYDAMDRLIGSNVESQARWALQFDLQGMPVLSTDGDGRALTLEYDNYLRPTRQIDAAGNITKFSYQIVDGTATGMLGSLNDPTEIEYPTYVERRRFDQLERPTSVALLAPGDSERKTSVTYDRMGAVNSRTDAYGNKHVTELDALSRPLLETDRLGNKTSYVYDGQGRPVQVNGAKGLLRKFEYDKSGRLVKEILPLGQSALTSYDAEGNVAQYVDYKGTKKVYSYDADNRTTQVLHYDAGAVLQRTTAYTWSPNGELVSWSDNEAGVQTSGVITYDKANRKSGETVSFPGGFTMNYLYTYSLGGKKTHLRWPDGTTIAYGYSKHAELETVTIPDEGTMTVNEFNWLAPSVTTLPGGNVEKKEYDGLLNLKSLSVFNANAQPLLGLENTYGAEQEPKQSTRSDSGGGSASVDAYSYDDELRLTKVVTANGSSNAIETFALDPEGNRVGHSRVSGAWTYDANNRLLQQGSGTGATSYDYDDSGNLIRKTEAGNKITKFFYNIKNRLIAVEDGVLGLMSRYGYDPFGRRIWKDQFRSRNGAALTPAVRTYFLYAEEGVVAEATQSYESGSTTNLSLGAPEISAQYGVRPDAPFTTGTLFIKTKNSHGVNTVGYYHYDFRLAPLQVTDRLGNIVWAARYDAFGRAEIITPEATASFAAINSSLRLPGQREDSETGLHYNYHRDYDPQTGRYIQSDPIGLDGGINTYGYAGGSPLSNVDPSGLFVKPTLPPGLLGVVGPSTAVIVATGTGAFVGGVGIGIGINYVVERTSDGSIGTHIYDVLNPHANLDFSPWSPDPEVNRRFVQDRDDVKEKDVKPEPYNNTSKPTCDELRKRIRHYEDAIAARYHLTRNHFGGVLNGGHATRIAILQKELDKLRARLARGDCAC